MKKMPSVSNRYEWSRKKIFTLGVALWLGFGGSRERISKNVVMQQKMTTKPLILAAQPNPTLGKSLCKANGKMMPPSEPPAAAMPVASPRLSRKKWPTAESEGVRMSDAPMPPSTPKQRTKCQYCVQDPKRSMLIAMRTLPMAMSTLGPRASKMGPTWIPPKKPRKMKTLKIQPILPSS